jgi:hypothetical protein
MYDVYISHITIHTTKRGIALKTLQKSYNYLFENDTFALTIRECGL